MIEFYKWKVNDKTIILLFAIKYYYKNNVITIVPSYAGLLKIQSTNDSLSDLQHLQSDLHSSQI